LKVGLGRLAAWHFSGGPVGPVSRWAATSKAEVGLTTYHVNRGRVERGKQGARTKSQREGQERKECKKGPLATKGGLYLDIFWAGPPEFLVTPLLLGPVNILSQGRCEDLVRPQQIGGPLLGQARCGMVSISARRRLGSRTS